MLEDVVKKIFPFSFKIVNRAANDFVDGAEMALMELESVARTINDIAKLQHRIFQISEQPNGTEQPQP